MRQLYILGLTAALALSGLSSAFAAERLVYRIPQKAANIAATTPDTPTNPNPEPDPTPPADILNDGQFQISIPNSSVNGLVGNTYALTITVKNVGSPALMENYPVAASGANVLGQTSNASALYCSTLTSTKRTLASGSICRVVLNMTVPRAGVTYGSISIGSARAALTTTGYSINDVGQFVATPSEYTVKEAETGSHGEVVQVVLKNTSAITSSFTPTGLAASSILQLYGSTTCQMVPPSGTCTVAILYSNYASPSSYAYDFTIQGKASNQDNSKSANITAPARLTVEPQVR